MEVAGPRFLTEKQVAQYFSISHRTLQNWRQRNQGPKYTKLGRLVRYIDQDVTAWLRTRPWGGIPDIRA